MNWSAPAYEAIADLVGRRTGLALTSRDSAEAGIRRAMTRARVSDLNQYLTRLVEDASALDDLVGELTVGETYFFREPAQFDFLRRVVLPGWRSRCQPGQVLRAWSAGCASGEEVYSLAILLEQEGLGSQVYLLGTDISRPGLARACRAVYGPWSLRGEGALTALPYLTRSGNLYRLEEKVRRRALFEYLNLALDVYPSPMTGTWGMDLILCRNVLIYFDRETVRRVAGRLFASLAEGGWLLTASSDPPLMEDAPFETLTAPEGVFYRKPAPDSQPSFQISDFRFEMEEAREPVPLQSEICDLKSEMEEVRLRQGKPDPLDSPEEVARHVRSLANRGAAQAERACAEAAKRHPLSAELHYLHAVLLLEAGRDEEAIRAVRRVLYLDPSLAVAHFTLGAVLSRRGDLAGARRAYRNARDLCAALPANEAVPLADGEAAGRLAAAASAQFALLEEDAQP